MSEVNFEDVIELNVERPDGTTFKQDVNAWDIPMSFFGFNKDGYLCLNFRALSLDLFGSGYRICGARFK